MPRDFWLPMSREEKRAISAIVSGASELQNQSCMDCRGPKIVYNRWNSTLDPTLHLSSPVGGRGASAEMRSERTGPPSSLARSSRRFFASPLDGRAASRKHHHSAHPQIHLSSLPNSVDLGGPRSTWQPSLPPQLRQLAEVLLVQLPRQSRRHQLHLSNSVQLERTLSLLSIVPPPPLQLPPPPRAHRVVAATSVREDYLADPSPSRTAGLQAPWKVIPSWSAALGELHLACSCAG
jgi:hypothetical protein